MFTLTARGSTLVYRRQILTTKVYPRAVRINANVIKWKMNVNLSSAKHDYIIVVVICFSNRLNPCHWEWLKHQDLQIFGLNKLNKSNFQPLEAVGRGSEPRRQVAEKFIN